MVENRVLQWVVIIAASMMISGRHSLTHAYDIGCFYPSGMPDPFSARNRAAIEFSNFVMELQYETPIVVHFAHQFTYCQPGCVAYHDDKALSMITKSRPPFSTPDSYFNSWSRTMCMMQCISDLTESEPWGPNPNIASMLSEWDFDVLPTNNDLLDCNHDPVCVQTVAENNDYDPRLIGQLVHLEIAAELEEDGWNSLGKQVYDAETDSVVPCTTNCAPYADITGYFPKNYPGIKWNDDKYEVKGRDKRWQPLLEENGYGSFNRQDHVTPHIGYTAKTMLIQEFQEAEAPNYDYKAEADLVVNRLQEVVSDESRISALRDFDKKLIVRGIIQKSFRTQFGSQSFEDYIMYLAGLSAVEHDAVIQAWREKVRFDGVRPTTVIQRWNDDVINTYNGDPTSTEPQDIKARDFQSYVRVMPHSEYPSGSASLCTVYADFTDLYTKEYFGGSTLELSPVGGEGGMALGCSGDEPFRFGCGASYHVSTMTELVEMCAESRLWGGMHFTKSIEAGKEIMSGVGALGLDYVKTLKNGSDWTNSYKKGDPRPVCYAE